MRKAIFALLLCLPLLGMAQVNQKESCTSIMVGSKASTDGSVITSHTCDGRYRTWMDIEPAQKAKAGRTHAVRKGTMHTLHKDDTTGITIMGTIPMPQTTFAYLNTAYPCFNEHQLAIGETTFGGPDTLQNPDGWFQIEELERLALMCCTTARQAIDLIADLIARYGYGDGGECITIADRNEVWQMEIIGCGKGNTGGVWVAQRVPDDHVAVSANIPRIGSLQHGNPDWFRCSNNVEQVALQYNLWDGTGEFKFWKAYNASYANGKNFREREWFILNSLAPSQHFSMEMDELPFSVRPDAKVSVRDVMALLRSTYEGTELDMCKNLLTVDRNGDTITSPVANPWMGGAMQQMLNTIAHGTVDFKRTVSVAWCSYSFVAQLRSWLPDQVGGICWIAVDNPGQSPRIPIFCGTTKLPDDYAICGQKRYMPTTALWQFRRANKLATVQWQRTKQMHLGEVMRLEEDAFRGLHELEDRTSAKPSSARKALNAYTQRQYGNAVGAWRTLEEKYWQMFGMGF